MNLANIIGKPLYLMGCRFSESEQPGAQKEESIGQTLRGRLR
jgi:hypothetical protein